MAWKKPVPKCFQIQQCPLPFSGLQSNRDLGQSVLQWPRSGGGSVLLELELVVSSPKEHGAQRALACPDGSSTWRAGRELPGTGSGAFHGFLSGASVCCQLSNGGISFQHCLAQEQAPGLLPDSPQYAVCQLRQLLPSQGHSGL